jgi:uncharacterized surface protein with fasciclin (FAS1) repeats
MSTLFRTATALVLALSVTATAAAHNHNDKTEKPGKNIVETAVAAGSFKTLATALEAAGLVETLQGKGPFTVFAPTDEAFAKIPKEKLAALLKDKEALTKVLTYHVVAGTVTAAEVVKLKEAKTVEGSTVAITVKDKEVMVNNAKVVTTDIMATNGVIHVIDTVIMPKETKKSKY